MGKKKAGVGKDVLPNRKYVVVSLAAATTTAVFTSFDTMMGAREGAGWLISRVDVAPRVMLDGWQVVGSGMRFQLCTGAQTLMLNADDDEVIATLDVNILWNTSGCGIITFPITWIGPVIVASRQLTCGIDGTDDELPLRSIDMLFTIWYQWIKLGAREWVEIAEARGIA